MMEVRHIELLVRLHPRGAVDLSPGSTYHSDLEVLGEALDLAWGQAALLEDELLPDRASALLSRWEATYAIHRVGSRTEQQRQDRLVARRRFLPDFRPSTLEGLVGEMVGFAVDVVEPFAFRCDDADSVCDDPNGVVDGAFVLFVDLDWTLSTAAGVVREEVSDLIDDAKPAHTVGHARFNDFHTDDPFSLTDRDLLGV